MDHTSSRGATGSHLVAGGGVLLAMACVALVAIGLVFAFVMASWHGDVAKGLGASGESLAGAVAHEVDRNFELLDRSIQSVASHWASAEVRGLPTRLRDMVLFGDVPQVPGFGALMVIDRDGHVAAASPGTQTRGASLADRDYFRVHLGSKGLGLFVSKPFVSRLSGKWVVALTRRLEDGAGAFDGVVLASVDLAYLSKLYAGLDVGPDRAVTLFRTDGTVIAREPSVDAAAHVWVGGDDAFTAMRSSRVGTFEGASPIDGRSRIMSFHRVGDLPMIQVVEVGGEDAYAAWWRRAAAVAALLALLCLTILALCVALDRALRRRAAAEEALSRLAATDALTGLANRRSFDVALSRMWSEAVETGGAVAVLMVDADAFKSYNDAFGHHAGDDVLRRVAGRLDALARELGGVACRWGGEEFAVLLPGLEETDALRGAETVCRAVRSLGLMHPSGVGGLVTVSVGVASVRPALGGSSKVLMSDADEALYRAKRDGRDRGAGSSPPRTVEPPSHGERRSASV